MGSSGNSHPAPGWFRTHGTLDSATLFDTDGETVIATIARDRISRKESKPRKCSGSAPANWKLPTKSWKPSAIPYP